jgi:hypothetical protein
MKHWTWQNFKSAVIDKLDHTKPNTHFAAHLTSLDEEGKLTWFGILSHHRLFGKKCNFVLANNMDFDDFADAVHMNPANQCTIKILMQDPQVEAKWRELVSGSVYPPLFSSFAKLIATLAQEKAETENLALTYGTGEERKKLEREKTCLAHNVRFPCLSRGDWLADSLFFWHSPRPTSLAWCTMRRSRKSPTTSCPSTPVPPKLCAYVTPRIA